MCMTTADWDSRIGVKTVPEFEAKCFRTLNDGHVSLVLLPLDNRIVTGVRQSRREAWPTVHC